MQENARARIAQERLDMRTKQIHDSFLDQKTRSMKYNLIFLEHWSGCTRSPAINENTETVLRAFLKKINDQIAFHNVHRLKTLGNLCRIPIKIISN